MDAEEKVERSLDSIMSQLDRIELKCDEVLAFRDALMAVAAPYISGKSRVTWLALLAKGRGSG